MFAWFRRLAAEYRVAKDSGRLLRKAYALYDEGRFFEASEALKFCRELLCEPNPTVPMMGVITSHQLQAARLLSSAASRIGDRSLALEAIADGLRIWSEVKGHMKPNETTAGYNEWEAWAKQYSAASTGTPRSEPA